jgi:hypothetical protein
VEKLVVDGGGQVADALFELAEFAAVEAWSVFDRSSL